LTGWLEWIPSRRTPSSTVWPNRPVFGLDLGKAVVSGHVSGLPSLPHGRRRSLGEHTKMKKLRNE
jgi:hypothetical protein